MPPPSTLIVVPTRREQDWLERLGGFGAGHDQTTLLGFGPVAAAARCAALLAKEPVERVLLVGIAGTYVPDELPVGSAATFTEVAIDGIGAGAGTGFLPPSQLGFPQWPGEDSGGGAQGAVMDTLPLALEGVRGEAGGARAGSAGGRGGLLLTACAAAASGLEVEERLVRWPAARAEDMEAFGAALACALAGVPFFVVRGISNRAGDRDSERWRVGEALDSARARALALLRALEEAP